MNKITTDSTPPKILFTYYVEELIDTAIAKSVYSARNIRNKDGKSLINDYAITADDTDFVMIHLDDAIVKLFSMYTKLTKSITDSLYFNVSKPDPVTSTKSGIQLGFEIKAEMKGTATAFNKNVVPVIDKLNKDFLVDYVMVKWSEHNKIADDITIYNASLQNDETLLIDKMFDLRKPAYGKTYST